MRIEEFHRLLRETGIYETAPEQARSPCDRMLGGMDVWYYLKIFRAVLSGYILARRGKFDNKAWAEHSLMTLRAIEQCGGRISISGMEHMAKLEGPAVYVANHMSLAETFLIPGILLAFGSFTIVVKKSLLRYPFFGIIMRAVEPVSVTRQNPREDLREVLGKGEEFLRRGRSVLIFPQATRSSEFDPEDFNTLGVKLAGRAGVPVVPLALKTDFMGIGRIFKDFGRIERSKTIYFRFGEPLMVNGNAREAHEKVVRFIIENLRKWGGKVRGQMKK